MLCVVAALHGIIGNIVEAAQPYRPPLRIAGGDGSVTLSWPRMAYYYALMGTTNLTDAGAWYGIATAASDFRDSIPLASEAQAVTNFPGTNISFTIDSANEQSFYRLTVLRPIPIFQFAAFYEELLEFSTTSTMTLNGPVHGNSNIYTGTGASLTFNRTVTTAKAISSPAWNGSGPTWSDTGTYNGNPPSVTNLPPLKVLSGLAFTNNLHGLIDMPAAGENPGSAIGASRLYNQAQTVILISNTTISVRLQTASPAKNPGSDPNPIYLWTTTLSNNLGISIFPFLKATNSFYDARESKTARVTDIDLGRYSNWLGTNQLVQAKFPAGSEIYPTVLYIADLRTNTSATFLAIRITNGVALPHNGGLGFTLVTPNPLYVRGNYNCTNATFLGTTNTSATVPSALICDALTILSANWNDPTGAGSLSGRPASTSNTVNAAIMAGIVPSTGSSSTTFSGGIHNFPRLLENWSGSTLWLNTSFVCLYRSAIATTQFQNPGVYYNPPTRKFNFDLNFTDLSKLPPGSPTVGISSQNN